MSEPAAQPAPARAAYRPLVLPVFFLALAVRVLIVVRSGGYLGNYAYDSGVYYAGGDALLHGLIPYRDFVFLHPPGVLLVIAPFAELGRLTNDHVGYLAANLGFELIGAIDAALVAVVARRLGAGRRAALAGGLFYAVWLVSGSAEYLVRLEPVGNLCLLLALFFATGPRAARRRNLVAAGAFLALAVSVKIWFAVPLVLVLAYLARRHGARSALLAAAGAAVAAVVVDGPFAVLAGTTMWSRVISDQLGRSRMAGSLRPRFAEITGLARIWAGPALGVREVFIALAMLAFLLVVRRAWRVRAFRPVVALAAVHVVVLLACPSFFGFYADYAAVPISLVVAGAAVADRVPAPRTGLGRLPAGVLAWLPVTAAAALTAVMFADGAFRPVVQWQDQRELSAAVASVRCVSSDSPEGLIELNALDRDFQHGCRDWVDVTGRTYFGADHAEVTRAHNAQWQKDLRSYLASGNRIFLVRTTGTGIDAATLRALAPKVIGVDQDGDSVVAGR